MIKVLTVALMQDSLLQGSQSSVTPLLLNESDSAAKCIHGLITVAANNSLLTCLLACMHMKEKTRTRTRIMHMGLFLSLFLSFQI
jgi:hypothetical protein